MRTILLLVSDWLLERRITRERKAVCAARSVEEARIHAAAMRDLINQRSPRMVRSMERRRGLA